MIEPLPKTPRRRLEPDQETARLYTEYHAKILRYCTGQLRSREEAEDAVQNTFIRVCTALRKGVVPEFEGPWLYKIAHNVCLSKRLGSSRRARVETPSDLDVLGDKAAAYSPDADELFGLGEALADMPANLRRPLLMREWQGMSYLEISEALGVSHSAVETLIFRARRHLAAALGDSVKKTGRAIASVFNLKWLLDAIRSLGDGACSAGMAAGAAGLVVAIGGGVAVDLATQHTAASHAAVGSPVAATAVAKQTPSVSSASRTVPRDDTAAARGAGAGGAVSNRSRAGGTSVRAGGTPSGSRAARPADTTGSGGSASAPSGGSSSAPSGAGGPSKAGSSGKSSSAGSAPQAPPASSPGNTTAPPPLPSVPPVAPPAVTPPVLPPVPPLPPPPSLPAPPTIAVPGNLVAEATGALGAAVDYTVTAADAGGGSVPVSCSPAAGSTFALGHTTVSCAATDKNGTTSRASFDVLVHDTTAPVLTVPANMTVKTSLASGAKVTFTATAKDLVDPAPEVTCNPVSGSLFLVQPTTVTCRAGDSSGNSSSKSFTVTVTLSAPALP